MKTIHSFGRGWWIYQRRQFTYIIKNFHGLEIRCSQRIWPFFNYCDVHAPELIDGFRRDKVLVGTEWG